MALMDDILRGLVKHAEKTGNQYLVGINVIPTKDPPPDEQVEETPTQK